MQSTNIGECISKYKKEFDELIGDVPEHAKYVIDKYTKDSCCVMCGHPAQPSVVVNKIASSSSPTTPPLS